MKLFFTIICLHASCVMWAQSDSIKNVWHFNGILQINNNGISPVPAFSLGKPAMMNTLFLKKGSFTYSPEFNYGSDGKPWVINQWFRYQGQKGNFIYRTGLNLSLFFGRETVFRDNKKVEIAKLNQYTALEGGIGYNLSDKTSINLTYWRSYGLDYGSVKSGHFLSLSATISQIPLSKSLLLQLRPNVFYINNTVPFEGFFVSSIVSIAYKKLPFSLFVQGVQPIWVKPSAKSNWNYGVNYIF